jgi:hypothetical protein
MSLCYDFQKWAIISLASVTISLTIGLVLIAHGYVDGNNNGKDDVQEYYQACQERNGFIDENNNGIDDIQEQEHFKACPKDYYETYPKDYSLPQNRQNLSETSCLSNAIVYMHNGKCYYEVK